MVRRSGFTLAEVVVGMMLLAIGGLGVAATALVSVKAFTQAEQQERALTAAQQLLDSLLLLPAHAAGARTVGQTHLSWPAGDSTAAIVVTVVSGSSRYELTGQR